ncbi:LPXTG cell wall anchor domain-containing protein [Cellulosimicrobium funkei]|nr:LPXTG cell wall anchor domain-containing protein [Cellulosimicrobium funkei]
MTRQNRAGAITLTGVGGLSSKGARATDYSPTTIDVARGGVVLNNYSTGLTAGAHDAALINLTFPFPVTNPRIHVAGVGGVATNGVTFHSQFSQTAPAGTFTGGSGTMQVNASNYFRPDSNTANSTCHSNNSGCGSAQFTGTGQSFQMSARLFNSGILSTAPRDEVVMSVSVDEDFGDAPASYDGGVATSSSYADTYMNLGATSTADNATVREATASPVSNATATGDADDAFTDPIPDVTAGEPYTVDVPVSGVDRASQLCGYIDLDGSGTFNATDERACSDVAAGATTVSLTWAESANAVAGDSFLRLRLSSVAAGVQAPTGRQQDGEIEDHQITIQAPPTSPTEDICAPEDRQYVKKVDFGAGSGTRNTASGLVFTNTDQTDFAGSEPSAYTSYAYQPNGRPTNGDYVVASAFQAAWYQPNSVDHTPGDVHGRAYISSFGLRSGGDDNNIAIGIGLPEVPAGKRIYPSFYASITGGALKMRLRNEAGETVFEAPVTLGAGANARYVLYEADYVVQPGDGALRFEVINTRGETTGNDGAIDDIGMRVCDPPPGAEFDYGDAPDTSTDPAGTNYPTRQIDGGPSHRITPLLDSEPTYVLGETVTGEPDGQPSSTADADEGDDGVTVGGSNLQGQSLIRGSTAQLDVSAVSSLASAPGFLSGWIDFNQDGDFYDAGEQIASDVVPEDGVVTISTPVPSDAITGETIARFRYSGQDGMASTGSAESGEVEDYRVTLSDATPLISLQKEGTLDGSAVAGETVEYSFDVANTGNTTLSDVAVNEVEFSGTGGISAVVCPEDAALMQPGAEVTCTATYVLTQADVDAGELTNTATATGTPPGGPDVTSPPSSHELPLPQASTLTLVKNVESGSAPASSWTLTASGPDGTLPGPQGTSGSAETTEVQVSPGEPYELSETGGPATYVQTGPWTCEDDDTGEPVAVAESSAVSIDESQQVTCAVTNGTAQITLLKDVANGPADPADWNLVATPESMDGLAAESVAGAEYQEAGNPDSTVEVRPDHAYTLTEELADSDSPSTYRQVSLEVLGPDGSWSPVDSEQVTAPEAGSTAVYRFTNRMPSPVELPLTGGTGSYLYYLAGGVLLLGALSVGIIARIRRQ